MVIGELELYGYAIERVYEHGRLIGVRLLETEAPDPPVSRRAPAMAPAFAIVGDSANEWRVQALNSTTELRHSVVARWAWSNVPITRWLLASAALS